MAVFAFDGTYKLSETSKCDLNAKCTADLCMLHWNNITAALLFNGFPLCCESLSGQKRSGHMDTTHNVLLPATDYEQWALDWYFSEGNMVTPLCRLFWVIDLCLKSKEKLLNLYE